MIKTVSAKIFSERNDFQCNHSGKCHTNNTKDNKEEIMKKFIATTAAILTILCTATACGRKTTDKIIDDTNKNDVIPSSSTHVPHSSSDIPGSSSHNDQNNNENGTNDNSRSRSHQQIMN